MNLIVYKFLKYSSKRIKELKEIGLLNPLDCFMFFILILLHKMLERG